MPSKSHFHAALDLFELTSDPLIADALRVFSTKNTPKTVVETAERYVECQYSNYLTLFGNSDKHQLHDYFQQFDTSSDGG